MRYYTRNEDYRLKGAPQVVMRLLAPLLVAFTMLLFGSGVAMGFVHGSTLQLARRIHGPAAFFWTRHRRAACPHVREARTPLDGRGCRPADSE